MRESTVEAAFRKRIKACGGEAYKFVSPGRRGVPDRLVLRPIPNYHRPIVANYIWFAEVKAPGKKPRLEQNREHKRLRDMGFVVEVVDR